MSKDKINVPKASTLMGSLRSMGYTFESAVADVIDNSISAHASIIKILFPTNPLDSIAVGIMDNGDGMTDNELFEAMRYGCMASEIERKQDDLGRFGLGMKAASLSQCRNLTVVSFDTNANVFSRDFRKSISVSYTCPSLDLDITSKSCQSTSVPFLFSINEFIYGSLLISFSVSSCTIQSCFF
jgi:hypothetical protein